jgi:hypothetical protein
MANSYFEVDTGVNVGGVSISATSGNISTTGNAIITGTASVTGNLTVSGNLTLNTTTLNYNANAAMPKQYMDVIAVVFGF